MGCRQGSADLNISSDPIWWKHRAASVLKNARVHRSSVARVKIEQSVALLRQYNIPSCARGLLIDFLRTPSRQMQYWETPLCIET